MSKEKSIIPLPEDNLDIIDFVNYIFPFNAISRFGISKSALKRAIENGNIIYDEVNGTYCSNSMSEENKGKNSHFAIFKLTQTRDGYKLKWLIFENESYSFPTHNKAKYNILIV